MQETIIKFQQVLQGAPNFFFFSNFCIQQICCVWFAGHFGRDGEYLKWLENDLAIAAADRAKGLRPWIVALGHRPVSKFNSSVQNTVLPLFFKYGVDLYLCGHQHSYSRFPPVSQNGAARIDAIKSPSHYHVPAGNGQSFNNSLTQIVVGSAGCDEMEWAPSNVDGELKNDVVGKKTHAVPDSSLGLMFPSSSFRKSLFPEFPIPVDGSVKMSAGLLHVINKSAVHWELFDSVTQRRIDEVWITK